MRCLAGVEWGACRQSLKRVYGALIRAAIDYGCMVYSSASKSQLLKVEAIQSQALRICCGAIRSSPITAVQVEMGEMPLEFRRLKLKMRYWINIKGHSDSHPIKKVLKNFSQTAEIHGACGKPFRPSLTTSPRHRPVTTTHPSQMHSTTFIHGLKCRTTHLHKN